MASFSEPTPTRGNYPSHSPPDVRYAPGLKLARFLGWFSLVLGLAELAAPQWMAAGTGVPHIRLLQAYGLREIVCGVGILLVGRPIGWMWARVAGDVLDLATLGYVLIVGASTFATGSIVSVIAVAGVMLLDIAVAAMLATGKKLEG